MLIRTKLVLGGLLTATVVAVLCGVLLWSELQQGAARAQEEHAFNHSRAALELAAASSAFLAQLRREPSIEEPLAHARLSSALARVQTVLDRPSPDATAVLELLTELRGDPPGPARSGPLAAARAEDVRARVDRLVAAVQLDVVELEHSSAVTAARVASVVSTTALVASAVSAALLLLGAILVLARLRRGLAALHAGAEAIRRGDLEHPVALGGQDELGLLARALDSMAARLRETVVTRDRLEMVVAERTSALETSRAEVSQRLVELETTRSRLGASDRLAAVGRLSRGLTHEINNPLAIVQANLDYLREELSARGPSQDAEVQSAIEEAAAATRRMTQILKDLSAFSREPGNDQGPSDLAHVLEFVKRLASPELHDRTCFVLDLPPGPLPVRGSASALGHVFGRLVLDALASYPATSPLGPEVRVVARREGTDVVVEVRDLGEPIPSDVLPHAFDPFYTPTAGFTAGRGGRGVGVGLAACYGIVESVGGIISVESAPGSGTVFRVRLRAATSDTRVALRGGAAPRTRPRVLVLHEDPLALAAVYRALAERFDVVPHTSARHALTLLGAGERFDAAVVHADLREVGAEAILEALVARSPDLARATVVLTDGALEGAALLEAVAVAARGDDAQAAV